MNSYANGILKISIINRPGVAGAVLQTPLLLTELLAYSLTDPFPPNLQHIIYDNNNDNDKHPNCESKRADILREYSPTTKCHMSCVICHVSCIKCHVSGDKCQVSGVRCHMSDYF